MQKIIYGTDHCSLCLTKTEHTCTCKCNEHGISQEIFSKFSFRIATLIFFTDNTNGPLRSAMIMLATHVHCTCNTNVILILKAMIEKGLKQ